MPGQFRLLGDWDSRHTSNLSRHLSRPSLVLLQAFRYTPSRKKQLADIELALPSLLEQEAIVSVLSDMDAEITALERRREKARALKQGTTQQLLTGRMRLLVPG